MANQQLINILNSTLTDIDFQIIQVKRRATDQGVPYYQLMDANGGWCMTPLLVAKAQVLNGLAVLKAAEGKK